MSRFLCYCSAVYAFAHAYLILGTVGNFARLQEWPQESHLLVALENGMLKSRSKEDRQDRRTPHFDQHIDYSVIDNIVNTNRLVSKRRRQEPFEIERCLHYEQGDNSYLGHFVAFVLCPWSTFLEVSLHFLVVQTFSI